MAITHEAYVDTSAFIAFLDLPDSNHDLFDLLFAEPPRLITTPLVIAEGHAWFLRRYDPYRAMEFLSFVEDLPKITILGVAPADLTHATELLRRFASLRLTMTDALGLHIMQVRSIQHCWSTDRHLGLMGAALAIDGS